MKEKTGMMDIGRREAGLKDRKMSVLGRPERRGGRRAKKIRQLPLTVVIIRAEVVKAL